MDFNRKLIELVRLHTSIYNTNDPRYTDNAHKIETWKQIARNLQVPDKECKKAWYLLREGYRRILKKQKESESNPKSRKNKDMRKWIYEDDLAFLYVHMKQRTFVEFSPSHRNNDIDHEHDHPKMVNEASTPAAIPQVTTQKRVHLKRSKTHEAFPRRSCSHEANSNNLINYILDNRTKRSDIQQFFDGIAATVQSFSPRDRVAAKRKVFEVISQMEMEIHEPRPAPSFQSKGSPVSDDMEVTESRSGLYTTPPPEAATAGLLGCNNSNDEDGELVLDIKVEPEQILGLNIKQEPYT